MELLFIRQFNHIEGFTFWFRNAIVGKKPIIQKTFWETYPTLTNPNAEFYNSKVIRLAKKNFLVKLMPRVHLHIGNTYKAQTIKNIIGKKPLLYRPPVGLMNPHVPGVLKKFNMRCIGWSKSAGEAGNRRLAKINKISTLAGAGEVILLHDTLPNPEYKQASLAIE